MKILYVAAECSPFYKVGGLGDVSYALPKELVRQGVDIRVVLPFYTNMPDKYKAMLKEVMQFSVKVGWRKQFCGIKTFCIDDVTYYFVDNLYYFDRPNIYGYDDDGERFAFFNLAVCEMMEKIDFIPDVLHVNDWHTAMIPALLKDKYHWIHAYQKIKTVLAIHNLQFQGVFDPIVLSDLFGIGMNLYHENGFQFYDCVNYLKGGINLADKIITVSPSYAMEIRTPQFGENLDGVLVANEGKLQGILNGIDYEINDPNTDPLIPEHFSQSDLSGKAKNKAALQKRLNLPVNVEVPILSMVTRLTSQKGCQLVLEALESLLERNIQFVLLGTGDYWLEEQFKHLAERYPEKVSVNIQFNTEIAQQIYAASDLFLMPSVFEPCGLSQLIALRYGTLPIVHETGGLRDTVSPYNKETGSGVGFSFFDFTRQVLIETIDRAITIYWNDKNTWHQLIKQAMSKDFSWKSSAKTYKEVYQALVK